MTQPVRRVDFPHASSAKTICSIAPAPLSPGQGAERMHMGETVAKGTDSGSLTDAQRAWAMTFCGMDKIPDAEPAGAAPGGVSPSRSDAPGAPASLSMRSRGSALDQSRDDALHKIAGESSDVPRRQVENELKEFLSALATAQKTKTVRVTDKVMSADRVLHDGLGAASPPVLKEGDPTDYDPAVLAKKMAAALPDTIPAGNAANFRKLKPVEVGREGSITDQIHHKYEEERDALIHRLPKSIQGLAKKAIDAAVEKGIPLAAEQIFSGLGAGSELENVVKQFSDEWAKKITGYEDAHKF
jgi:hypothetical protein